MSALRNRRDNCPAHEKHTPAPEGYVERSRWAARMTRTHRQEACGGCGLFAIWTEKSAPELLAEVNQLWAVLEELSYQLSCDAEDHRPASCPNCAVQAAVEPQPPPTEGAKSP